MSKKSSNQRGEVKAIILAAGYATRLYPLTLNLPKPLLFLNPQKTVIDFIVDELQASGQVSETIVVTNNKFYSHFLKWARVYKGGMRLTILNDGTRSNEDRLGAIGDIHFAINKRKVDGDLVVVAGDNVFENGIKKFLTFALKNRPYASLGVFDIKNKSLASRFGVVSLKNGAQVSSFEEKPDKPKSTLIATCLYYFPQETIKFLDQYFNDCAMSNDASGNYIRWLLKVDKVMAFVLKGTRWYDIGHLDSYKEVVVDYNDKF